jgi:hypothetical protein
MEARSTIVSGENNRTRKQVFLDQMISIHQHCCRAMKLLGVHYCLHHGDALSLLDRARGKTNESLASICMQIWHET